jgi:hypothetical protein
VRFPLSLVLFGLFPACIFSLSLSFFPVIVLRSQCDAARREQRAKTADLEWLTAFKLRYQFAQQYAHVGPEFATALDATIDAPRHVDADAWLYLLYVLCCCF